MPKFLKLLLSFVAIAFSIGAILRTGMNVAQAQHDLTANNFNFGNFNPIETQGEFYDKVVSSAPVVATVDHSTVLGSTTGEKRIEVDLTTQRLYAYEGDQKFFDFLISSGKWGKTPTGTFKIWTKFKYTKMSGGSKELGTYYYLPNVPFTMFFYNDTVPAARGFGIHGTYWHDNFGTPMSHGCINMKTEEAEQLFYWASPEVGDKNSMRATTKNPGTEVVIYGVAPTSK